MAQKQQEASADDVTADEVTAAERSADDALEQNRRQYAEEFALMWEGVGSPLMDGRILGYLMIMREPFISSADLAGVLNASAGSVSMSTRRLAEAGFIKRHVVPGDRSHYFRTDNDIWGSWLAGERKYLDRERVTIERGLDLISRQGGPADAEARQRLINGRDYMTWLASYHRKMLLDWEAFKADRDAADPSTGPDSLTWPASPASPPEG